MTSFARDLIHTSVGCMPGEGDCERIHDLLNEVEDDRAHKEANRLRERAAEIHEGAVDKFGEVYGSLRFAAKNLFDAAEMIDPYMVREGLLVRKRDDKALRPVKEDDKLRCPRCAKDITDYNEDDFAYLKEDDRPYCSTECVIATWRAALKDREHQRSTDFSIEAYDGDIWVPFSFKHPTIEAARSKRDEFRAKHPDAMSRIIQWIETSTVVETDETREGETT